MRKITTYRTPSSFQYKQKANEAKKTQAKRPTRSQNLAKRNTYKGGKD
ncbi:MAG TPA: hypothetical protein VFE94_01265 [Candidatus Paceibacterota bacterium]|nr:hypothetical protein [Candidatus Paceibacterota bacterium]